MIVNVDLASLTLLIQLCPRSIKRLVSLVKFVILFSLVKFVILFSLLSLLLLLFVMLLVYSIYRHLSRPFSIQTGFFIKVFPAFEVTLYVETT